MRRSSLLSTLTLGVLAAVMMASFVVGITAQAQTKKKSCLNGCGKGQKPPGCCEPPPCEFFYELTVARSLVRSTARAKQMLSAQAKAEVKSGKSLEMANFLEKRDRIWEDEHTRFANCPGSTAYLPHQSFQVDPASCEITRPGGINVKTVDQAKSLASSVCEEIAEASFRYAERKQALCRAIHREGDVPVTAGELQDMYQNMAERAVKSLEDSLSDFWRSCNKFTNSKKAQAAAKSALDALKKGGRDPRREAKRASGYGRGRS